MAGFFKELKINKKKGEMKMTKKKKKKTEN